MKTDSVRSSLIQLQSFPQRRLMSTQNTGFWCLFHAFKHVLCMTLCTQVDRIEILVILSMGSTINAALMMECKLIAHPTWEMYWKKLVGITTLSCRYDQYLFWFPPPAMLFFHLSSDQWKQYRKKRRSSLILQNSIAPSSSRCTWFPWRRSWVVLLRPLIGMLKSLASNFNAYSSTWTSGISCSLLFKFITNLFDPWEILTQDWELSLFRDIMLISTPFFTVQATSCNFQFGPNLGVPSDPTFRFRCSFLSWMSVFTTNHCTELWEFCNVFRYEVLSEFNTFRNPASIQNLLNLSCCDYVGVGFVRRPPSPCSRSTQCYYVSSWKWKGSRNCGRLTENKEKKKLDGMESSKSKSDAHFMHGATWCGVQWARMYSRRCLHSSMIRMLCTASWGPSQTKQTPLRCPRPESFALTPHWTGCRLCFVVDLVEEHVHLGGSQFSESILER